MPELPDRPDLDQLRRQARELQRAAMVGQQQARHRLGAVSHRTTLSVAQLALAREYGFASWAALRAEAQRRRRRSDAATRAPALRWSFGGAAPLPTPAGTLLPGQLIAGPRNAVLTALLMPTEDTPPRTDRGSSELLAELLATVANEPPPGFEDVVLTDDSGRSYAVRGGGMSTSADRSMWLRVRLDPVPQPECGWLELRTRDGATTRLLAATRPTTPVQGRTDGARLPLDITTALPRLDDTTVHLDSLDTSPESWHVTLRARPSWWSFGEDQRSKQAVLSVRAEDDRGGRYQSSFGGSIGRDEDGEELSLRFLPRLDPLACALTLTFSGSTEQSTVHIRL